MIVTAILPIFILIGLGILLKNHFSFGEGFWDTSNRLIFWVLFPSLLFTSMSRAELAQLPTGGMAVAVIPAILTVAFLTLVVQKTYPMDTRGFTSVFQGSIRLNTYLGLAIALCDGPLDGRRCRTDGIDFGHPNTFFCFSVEWNSGLFHSFMNFPESFFFYFLPESEYTN